MKVRHKCCPQLYDNYFSQIGRGDYPVFRGYINQGGNGIGNLLFGAFKSVVPLISKKILPKAVPLLKMGGKKLGKKMLASGVKSLENVVSKRLPPRKASTHFKRRLKKDVRDFVLTELKNRKRKVSPSHNHKNNKIKRIKTDIFS